MLQQGEGCAAFGNAAFLEAAVEAAVEFRRLPRWFGVRLTQWEGTHPLRKTKVRDKLLKLHKN